MNHQGHQIVAFRDEHGPAFARLNRDWLDAAGIYEEADGVHLYTPRESILDGGGHILIAEKDGEVTGSCALVQYTNDTVELAKLAVAHEARGIGLGRLLTERIIDLAREQGASKIVLFSNSSLTAAVALYESLGFRHAPIPQDPAYQTADVHMVLELDSVAR